MYELEAFKNAKLKEDFRRKVTAYLIQFPKQEKLAILNQALTYVQNFLILDDSEVKYHSRIPVVRFQCNRETLHEVFEKISKDQWNDLVEEPQKYTPMQYILFVKENGRSFDETLADDISDVYWAKFRFDILKYFVTNYTIFTSYYVNRHMVIEMSLHQPASQEPMKVYKGEEELPPCYIVTLLGGIGDYFLTFSLFYEFIQRKKQEGKDVYICIMNSSEELNGYDKFFLQNQKRVLCNNMGMWIFFRQRDYSNLINTENIFLPELSPSHIVDRFKSLLGLEPDFYPYTHNTVLERMLMEAVSQDEFEYIEEITNKKNLIGLQYFNGRYVVQLQKYIVESKRIWPIEHVQRFLDLCKEKGFEVLLLNQNPYSVELHANQMKTISLPAYALVVSKLKLIVGIDSSVGHIAAFFNQPNITIWGEQSPLDAFSVQVSFRTLRNNYSIWSKNKNIGSISPELVLSKVQDFFDGTLDMTQDLISYEDSANQKYTYILEE